MSYQVLARKWRPRRFSEMVGQEHVVRALSNALAGGRLHHAYLFTGTRGVGKTTIARIVAKGLNCESGVTAEPCGECSACVEVDGGRFVDLIEVDAASRARVDETRDLMDNVLYAPARGRYKVYLIDEVHMFSKHSFNALLKTLEEPPAHVKFLLATTDPQKLPVTVLSRCLQFHLRALPEARIGVHLRSVLNAEHSGAKVSAGGLEGSGSAENERAGSLLGHAAAMTVEEGAVSALARAARGSMRDALSLLDQAIAYGGGGLRESDVQALLGTPERADVWGLLEALACGDGKALLEALEALAETALDFDALLAELLEALQMLAVLQAVPNSMATDSGDGQIAAALSSALTPEDVQLFYQIGIQGRRDLPFAPTLKSGFEMIMLRMLAFKPLLPEPLLPESSTPAASVPPSGAPPRPNTGGHLASNDLAGNGAGSNGASGSHALEAHNPLDTGLSGHGVLATRQLRDEVPVYEVVPHQGEQLSGDTATDPMTCERWAGLIARLGLTGLTGELAANCEWVSEQSGVVHLRIAPSYAQLNSERARLGLQDALTARLGRQTKISVTVGERDSETPAQRATRLADERLAEATASLREDPKVAEICDMFGAVVDPQAVRLASRRVAR